MIGRGSERSSILLLGRNSVVIGALLITIASFGIGYFFGYRGGGSSVQEKQATESSRPGEVVPLEERRIIEVPAAKDAAVKPAVVPPVPGKPSEPAAEASAQKSQEAAAPKAKGETSGNKSDKSSNEPKKGGAEVAAAGVNKVQQDDTSAQSAQAVKTAKAAPADQPAQAGNVHSKSSKHVREKAAKKAKNRASSGKLYTVQLGAFPNKEGAEQLYQRLKANGYAPYIVNGTGTDSYYKVRLGTFKNKEAAEKSAAALLKKTGSQNFVTVAQ